MELRRFNDFWKNLLISDPIVRSDPCAFLRFKPISLPFEIIVITLRINIFKVWNSKVYDTRSDWINLLYYFMQGSFLFSILDALIEISSISKKSLTTWESIKLSNDFERSNFWEIFIWSIYKDKTYISFGLLDNEFLIT